MLYLSISVTLGTRLNRLIQEFAKSKLFLNVFMMLKILILLTMCVGVDAHTRHWRLCSSTSVTQDT